MHPLFLVLPRDIDACILYAERFVMALMAGKPPGQTFALVMKDISEQMELVRITTGPRACLAWKERSHYQVNKRALCLTGFDTEPTISTGSSGCDPGKDAHAWWLQVCNRLCMQSPL